MSSYTNYPVGTRIKVKESGIKGDAFESALGYVAVFLDGEEKVKILKLNQVEFLSENKYD